jgi:hypothetical protein
MLLDVMGTTKVVVEFKGGSVLRMASVDGTKIRVVGWGGSILSTWRRWQWQFGRDWGGYFLGGGHGVEEADSKLRRWERLLSYIQLHNTQTGEQEKIRGK